MHIHWYLQWDKVGDLIKACTFFMKPYVYIVIWAQGAKIEIKNRIYMYIYMGDTRKIKKSMNTAR